MNFISFVTLQLTDWGMAVYMREQTAMWEVKFALDVHDKVLKCESSSKDYFGLIF